MELEEKEWKANLVLVSQYINFGGFNFVTGDLFIFGFSIYSISNSSNSYITLGCLTYFFINGNSAFSIKFFSLPYVFLHKVVFLNINLYYLSKKKFGNAYKRVKILESTYLNPE